MTTRPWSFSKLKAFEQCPRQFYHVKVLKEYTEPETDAMRYGTAFHEACERYIRDGEPIPAKFSYATPVLDALNDKPGKKLCEYKMGLTEHLTACEFDAPDVWWRGIADLTILHGSDARVVDYKTGRNAKYADKGQLELMALATFAHFPEVDKVLGALLFTTAKKLIKDSYTRDDIPKLWEKWLSKLARLDKAHETDVWNPNPSGLCKNHCIVLSCPHNGRH